MGPGHVRSCSFVDRYHSRVNENEIPPGPQDERPSKSQRKREMQARQDLGERLVELSADVLQRMALPETLREAIAEARRIKAHEGRRRQMQYIGRLMRDSDAAAIQARYDEIMGGTRASVALMHRCERLRDRLVEDEAALGPFLDEHPGVDVQWLRAKLRAARLERAQAKAPRHGRELYRWLHEMLSGARRAPAAAAPADGAPGGNAP
jgi:ribosome-associated protein